MGKGRGFFVRIRSTIPAFVSMLYLDYFSLMEFNPLICHGPSIWWPKVTIVCDLDMCYGNDQGDVEPSLHEDRREQADRDRPALQRLVSRDIGGDRHVPMAILKEMARAVSVLLVVSRKARVTQAEAWKGKRVLALVTACAKQLTPTRGPLLTSRPPPHYCQFFIFLAPSFCMNPLPIA